MDTITLQGGIFISIILYAIGFLVMLFTVIMSEKKQPGMRYFIFYFLLMSVGMTGIYFRESLTPLFSVIIANSLLIIGAFSLSCGVVRFFNKKPSYIFLGVVFTLFLTGFITFTYASPSVTFRIIVFSFISIVIFSKTLFSLLTNRENKSHKIDLLELVVIAYLLLYTLRILEVLFTSSHDSFFDYEYDAIAVILLAIVGTITISGILSLINNRYIKELKVGDKTLFNFIATIPTPAFVHDEDGKIINVSKTFSEVSGYKLEDIPTVNDWTEKAYGDKKEEIKSLIASLYEFKDKTNDNQVTINTKSGEDRIWSFHSGYIGSLSSGKDIAMSVALDVTERTEMSRNLQNSESRLILAQEISKMGAWEVDLSDNTIWASKQSYTIYELEEKDTPLTVADIHKMVDKEDEKRLNEELMGLIKGNKPYSISFKLKTGSGQIKYIDSKAILEKDSDGNPIKVVGVIQDITKLRENEIQLEYAAYNDYLTGLPNRRFYEESLLKFKTEKFFPLTIVMADINGLKLINDAFGHDSGDELLKSAANIIASSIGGNDIAARIGGDEFVMVLPNTDGKRAENIIKTINKKAEKIHVQSISLSISFGSKTMTDSNGDIQELYRAAEDRMYREKLLEIPSMRSGAIETILSTLYEKDSRSEAHSRSVSIISERIAEIFGMSRRKIAEVKTAGLLHDIGKIIIPLTIINKEGTLTKIEYSEMKNHPEIGFRILNSTHDMRGISDFVLNHHERWDGLGYPRQIKDNDIPLQSRIIAIADAFDAMTSERTYRDMNTKEEALIEIIANSGTQFDPKLVECFKNNFEIIIKGL